VLRWVYVDELVCKPGFNGTEVYMLSSRIDVRIALTRMSWGCRKISHMETMLPERFWMKVDKNAPGGCWLWMAGLQTAGYGHAWLEGRSQLAHRAAYLASGRTIPDGMQLDHKCRIRQCVNPDHLEPVTSQENSRRSPISVNSINAQKTHCSRGHAYSHTTKNGKRACRTCDAIYSKRRRLKAQGIQDRPAKPVVVVVTTPQEPALDLCPAGHVYHLARGRRWCPTCLRAKAVARDAKRAA
jgi:hypothetical protein